MPTIYNKVTANGTTLIDLSQDTVTSASHILSGYVGHLADGTQVTGTGSSGSGVPVLQSKSNISPTGSSQTITADNGYDGLSSVQINAIPSQYIVPTGTSTITANGTGIDIAAYASVNVAVSAASPNLQTKTGIVPTESSQTITYDTGYDGLNSVQINAISSSYVGSGVPVRTSLNGEYDSGRYVVYGYSGYYPNYTDFLVPNGSATTPATTITANPSISVNSSTGLITVTASASQSVTPTISGGYIRNYGGTAGTITVSGSSTSQLTVKAATTYYPQITDQTIASGQYLTGKQTIKAVVLTGLTAGVIKMGSTVKVGDANATDGITSITGTFTSDATASAADILQNKTAYVRGSSITGSLVIQSYYTGTGIPSAGLGNNGDIYLQTSS